MSQIITGTLILLLNLFSLNLTSTQASTLSSQKKDEYDAAAIARINEINREVKKANEPRAGAKPLVKVTSEDREIRDSDDEEPRGEKLGSQPKANSKAVNSKTATEPTSGYRKNAKGPENTPAPTHLKVKTDDTPEELNFPGTDD